MKIDLRQISLDSADHAHEIALRSKILREPLGLKFSPEDLEGESTDFRFGAFRDTALLGCLLLRSQDKKTMKMRQVAVAVEAQGLGIGKKLVFFAEDFARQRGCQEIILNAREAAVSFYLALGYEIYGDPFTEVTLPHRRMRKSLLS